MLKKIISKLAQYDAAWLLMKPIVKFSLFITASRSRLVDKLNEDEERREMEQLFGSLFTEKEVLHGPFKGVKYPALNSIGSALYPKLLGSYEREVHGALEKICNTQYSEIINIGCGEGYYAVGLGRRIQNAKIFAFDTDADARRLCHEMAVINQIQSRLEVNTLCTSDYLGNFKFTTKGLIVCDCEGFEIQLFNQSNIKNLKYSDLLIETHDFINISISTVLLDLFSPSHNVTVIKSIDDIEKAKNYHYPETEGMDLAKRKKLFAEKRPAIMEWLFITAKDY
jgi:hypothetical protein